jgi:hypothetical protein
MSKRSLLGLIKSMTWILRKRLISCLVGGMKIWAFIHISEAFKPSEGVTVLHSENKSGLCTTWETVSSTTPRKHRKTEL